MKTWKAVTYEGLLDPELIEFSWQKASEGKRGRKSVKRMSKASEQAKLIEELRNETYEPVLCRNMQKWDKNANKMRDISCPAFKDQMVHWALMTLMKPYMEREFIKHNVANVPGRGLSYGNKMIKHWSHKRGTKYVLKMDVTKYYPSIDIPILMGKLKKKIRDTRIIALIEKTLYKEAPYGTGLTLGSYLNLWLALFYLDELDHIIKEKFGVKFFIRYVDDMLILVKTKRMAQKLLAFISNFLHSLKLRIKDKGKGKSKIYEWTRERFVDMLGMRTYRSKQVIRRNIYLKIRRLMDKVKKKRTPHKARSIMSYKGILQHSDCIYLYKEMQRDIKRYKLKELVAA